jgi:hypothetical protein
MRTNYVLIDYENVQPASLAGLDAEPFRVLVFVGASQDKLRFELADTVHRLGTRAEYIKISGHGRNALDFHIAYYLGQLAAKDPKAYFHIISKDAGFDPLIYHLKKHKVFAARSNDVADIPLLKAASAKCTPERIKVVVAKLRQLGCCKPNALKTLTGTINALFPTKRLVDEELTEVLNGLQSQGLVSIQENKVSYSLAATEA